MAQFDPRERKETRLFRELYRTPDNKPVLQEMKYAFVSYDGEPDRYIEPLPAMRGVDISGGCTVLKPTQHFGQIVGFEFFTSRPLEVHSFDDFDAATT